MSKTDLERYTEKFGDLSQWNSGQIYDYACAQTNKIRSFRNWRGKEYTNVPSRLQKTTSSVLNSYPVFAIMGASGAAIVSGIMASGGYATEGVFIGIASAIFASIGAAKETYIRDRINIDVQTQMHKQKAISIKAKKGENFTSVLILLDWFPEPRWVNDNDAEEVLLFLKDIASIKKNINFLIKNPKWRELAETNYKVTSLVTVEIKNSLDLMIKSMENLEDIGYANTKVTNMLFENINLLNVDLSEVVHELINQHNHNIEASNIFLKSRSIGANSSLTLEKNE